MYLTQEDFEKRYKDREYIGSGGFSKVYKVFDEEKDLFVALKIADVRPELKQFTLQREVELVNSLPSHPNIAQYDACYRFNTGLLGEIDCAILKFYESGNLEQFLTRGEYLTESNKRLIVRGIIQGVAFLHKNNIIHRDMKSQNILMHREDGVWIPKITDFGLSRFMSGEITTNSSIGLSFSYAAPEQIKNTPIYKNVDLWAVGVIIYRIIAGELPFLATSDDGNSSQSQLELSQKIVNVVLPPKLETLPEPYRTIIKKCLVADIKERVQTAEELLDILNLSADATKPIQPAPSGTQVAGDHTIVMSSEPETMPLPGGHAESFGNQIQYQPPFESPYQPQYQDPHQPPYAAPYDPFAPVSPPQDHFPPYSPPQEVIPEPEYTPPPDNSKKIIDTPPVAGPTDNPPVSNYEPRSSSGERGAFSILFIVLLLLVLIAGGIVYWYRYAGNRRSAPASNPLHSEVQRIEPKNPTFNTINRVNDAARLDSAKLEEIKFTLDSLARINPSKYRPIYILAKNRIYIRKYAHAMQLLKYAEKKAVKKDDKDKILKDLQKDSIVFSDSAFIRKFGAEFAQLKNRLSNINY